MHIIIAAYIRVRKWKVKIIKGEINPPQHTQSLLLLLVLATYEMFMPPSWPLHFSLSRIGVVRICKQQWIWMYFICWPSILLKTCFPYQESYQIFLNYESSCLKKKKKDIKIYFFSGVGGLPTRRTRWCPEYCSLNNKVLLSSPISDLTKTNNFI